METKQRSKKKKILTIFIILLIVAAVGVGAFFGIRHLIWEAEKKKAYTPGGVWKIGADPCTLLLCTDRTHD